ncbi:MAG TPA: hypothetical protein VGA78_00840 [Gemmatimonadales bacterium]
MRARAFPLGTFLLATWATPAAAQLISIRTVPISQSHQFDLFPSLRGAMGGVSLAVDDSLHDPFGNPAKGARLGASRFFGSPGVYSVSSGAGAGRSLPLGAWVRSGRWFGGAAVAFQQIDLSENTNPIFPLSCPACDARGGIELPAADRTQGNAFGYALLGMTLPGTGLSLGASLSWAGLHAVDGVDLLYPGSVRLRQNGHSLDLRVGALKQWQGDRALSAVVLHNRFASTHDVFYLDSFWDPGTQQFAQRPRPEQNLDHTNTWGAQVEYTHPLPEPGWRMGWVATTNLMSHPKIPNYEIQNIPRDPGNSEAFNLGVGVSKSDASSTVALDLLYQPIWSYTWADAAAPITTSRGSTIPAGGKTIENRFRFSNALLRLGFAQDMAFDEATKAVGLQLGLAVHRIDYSLVQDDNVQVRTRRQNEDWIEWTPTWGLSLRFPAWELRYRGSVTHGTGRPGVQSGNDFAVPAAEAGTILVAPSGPLTLTGVKVMTHQVAIVFPFR